MAGLAEQFNLHLAHIHTVIDFAASHRAQLDAQVAANDATAERVKETAEQRADLMAL